MQGDITGIANANGTVVVEYSYDVWGKLLSVTGSLADTIGQINSLRYRGYYYDTETGLYYVSSRYYDPEVGRFISPDTTDILTATPMGLTDKNLYAYCDNNPVVRVDRGGQFWETVFDIISLGASIVEVCINPTDPWAWAGLAGDAIDLIPFVTGVGEVTRTVKTVDRITTSVKTIDKGKDVAKVGKTLPTNNLIPTHDLTKSKNQMKKLVEDIRVNGIQEPIKYVRFKHSNYVVDGHHRLAAAKQLRINNVPVSRVRLPYRGYKTPDDFFDRW